MDFNKVQYLIAVAEMQSFSKAAEKLFISQPALTRCIKNMETELGVKLFDRSCSPIQLTYAGERYLAGMRKILQIKGELDLEMEEIAHSRRDRLILGMPSTRSHTWLPRILPLYTAENPEVEVQLVEGNTLLLSQMLLKETVDIFFICTEPILMAGLQYVPLINEQMTVVVSRECALFKNRRLPPNQHKFLQYLPPALLEKIPFYSPTSSQGAYYLARQVFEKYSVQPQTAMELINTTTAYRLAPRGKGFAFIVLMFFSEPAADGPDVVRPRAFAPVSVTYEEQLIPQPIFCSVEETPTVRTMGLAIKKDRSLSPAATNFIELAKRELPKFSEQYIPRFQVRHDIDFTGIL